MNRLFKSRAVSAIVGAAVSAVSAAVGAAVLGSVILALGAVVFASMNVVAIVGLLNQSVMVTTVAAGIVGTSLGIAYGKARRAKNDAGSQLQRHNRRRPPLHLLNAVVKGLWSAKTYERVFRPVIADIHHEWADARRHRESFRAWWIRNVRGRYAVLDVARHQIPWSIWSAIKRLLQLMFTFSK